jgi:hypothetical protein
MRPHYTDDAVQTEIAAFLIGMGKHSYYLCGSWEDTFSNSQTSSWLPLYDLPLGAPLGNATLQDRVWHRSFVSGTKATFDTTTETGTLRGFGWKISLEDAIGSHACSLEASMRMANGIPLGWSPLLPVGTEKSVQTLKDEWTGQQKHRRCHSVLMILLQRKPLHVWLLFECSCLTLPLRNRTVVTLLTLLGATTTRSSATALMLHQAKWQQGCGSGNGIALLMVC